jgi:hypothetical protein
VARADEPAVGDEQRPPKAFRPCRLAGPPEGARAEDETRVPARGKLSRHHPVLPAPDAPPGRQRVRAHIFRAAAG